MYNYEVITSRNNQLVKWVCTLHDKKGREKENCFIAEGAKLTLEAIDANLNVTHVFISASRKDMYYSTVQEALLKRKNNDARIIIVDDTVFEKISTEKGAQGVLSVIKYLDFFFNMNIINKEEFFLGSNERAIVLCSVRDPSNLGAVIRSAVAFGTDTIILSSDCADVYNPKTVRSAMGSLFRVKIVSVSSLSELITALQYNNRRVFAAELTDNAISLTEHDTSPTDCFMIGNEGHGIPSHVSKLCDGSVYIPISKKTESLNASVAAAIFMWEQSRN